MDQSGYDVIVAIDFGTSRTASSFYLEKEKRSFALVWPRVPKGHSSRKAPTVILYEKENVNFTPIEIGYEAISRYSEKRGANLLLLKYDIKMIIDLNQAYKSVDTSSCS